MPGMKSVVGMTGLGGAHELAEMLRQMGRGRDTVLAHITPEEAQMLMDMGGSGDINPNTGLPEFQYDYGEAYGNVTGEPQDYSYMNIPPAYGGDVEAQAGGFYGETPTARLVENRVNELGQQLTTTRLEPNQERALPANVYADLSGMSGRAPIYTPMTSLAPEFGIRDVEVQPGGFYGGRAPSPEEYARVYPPEQPGMLTRGAQAVEDTAAQARQLAQRYPTVARLLSTGAQSLPALLNAARLRRQEMGRAAELSALGAPLRQQAENLRQQALAGQLTPQQAQQQEAQRARLRQAAATRGATTGTQQAMIEGQLARQRATLTETNLNNALRQLNLANAYEEEAIKRKIAADREVGDVIASIFANIGQQQGSVAPQGGGQQAQAPRQQPELGTATRRPEVRQGQA